MKYLFIVSVALMFTACAGESLSDIKDFIPGSYIRPFETEFAVGIDSLVVQEDSDNHYIIFKYSRYQRLMNDISQPVEEHRQKWAGALDEKEKVIREFQGGKVIHFNAKENQLFVGTTAYEKIK